MEEVLPEGKTRSEINRRRTHSRTLALRVDVRSRRKLDLTDPEVH